MPITVNWIKFLSKEYHHIMVHGETDTYEPTMVIMDHNHPGKSFHIPLQAMWKYNEPYLNKDAMDYDQREYAKLKANIEFRKRIAVGAQERAAVISDIACCLVAESYAQAMGFMLCLGYNLAKCMQMFDISPEPQNAAQLLLWIQDGLDQLKDMPPAPYPEDEFNCGEVEVFDGGKKIIRKDLTVTESNLLN